MSDIFDAPEAAAVEVLAQLFAGLIRADDNPDHGGPEDEAMAFSEGVVLEARMLFEVSDPRQLPRAVVLQRVRAAR